MYCDIGDSGDDDEWEDCDSVEDVVEGAEEMEASQVCFCSFKPNLTI